MVRVLSTSMGGVPRDTAIDRLIREWKNWNATATQKRAQDHTYYSVKSALMD